MQESSLVILTELTDRDRRVVDLIATELAAYELGMSDAPTVIEKVGRLLGDFRDARPAQVEELRRIWWDVEFALALAKDQQRDLCDQELDRLGRAVTELEVALGLEVDR